MEATTTTMTIELDSGYIFTEEWDPDVMDDMLGHSGNYGKRDINNLGRYKRARKHGNTNEVVYEFKGKVAKEKRMGRLYPKDGMGLQGFPFDIRNPLLEKYYHDCDMVNAHYVLLAHLADKWGLKNDNIRRYIANRDEELGKVSGNRGIAKVAFLKVAYGGNIKLAYGDDYNDDGISPEGDMSLLKAIEGEMKNIVERCWIEHKDLHKWCSSKDHPKFSCFAYVLQTEEREVLLEIVRYMKSVGRQVGVLIHDGCCIKKKKDEATLPAEILRGAEKAIRDKFGYSIALAVKEWNHHYVPTNDDGLVPADVTVDDAYAARRFCELMGDEFIRDGADLWVFDREIGMWSSTKEALQRVITAMGPKLIFKQLTAQGIHVDNFSGKMEKQSALVKAIPLVAKRQDGYMASRMKSDVGKLLFADGVYDFQTDKFTEGFDSSIVFTARIPRPFPRVRDDEKIKFIKFNTFEEPYAGRGDGAVCLHQIMVCIYGDYTVKHMMVVQGPNDSSKGMSGRIMRTGFGSYVTEFNGNSLLFRNSVGESERDATFVLEFNKSRIAIANEIRCDPDSKARIGIDANLAKALSSGGDGIRARKLYENSADIINKAAVWIFVNDMPPIIPAQPEISSRIVPINTYISFVKNPKGALEKKANPIMGHLYKEDEYGDAFVHLILDTYRNWKAAGFPEVTPPKATMDGMDTLVPVRRIDMVLPEKYLITNNMNDEVDFKELATFLRQNEYQGTENRIGRELSALGCGINKRKVGRKLVTFRTGIREKRDDEE